MMTPQMLAHLLEAGLAEVKGDRAYLTKKGKAVLEILRATVKR